MEIGIIGATGNTRRAIVTQALSRGHEATTIVKDPSKTTAVLGADVPVVACDAFDLTAQDHGAFDIVANAFATVPEPCPPACRSCPGAGGTHPQP